METRSHMGFSIKWCDFFGHLPSENGWSILQIVCAHPVRHRRCADCRADSLYRRMTSSQSGRSIAPKHSSQGCQRRLNVRGPKLDPPDPGSSLTLRAANELHELHLITSFRTRYPTSLSAKPRLPLRFVHRTPGAR